MKLMPNLIVVAAMASLDARSSGFEICELVGEVRAISPAASKRTFNIQVVVSESAKAKDGGGNSYSDCSERVGKSLDIELRLPRDADVPQQADRITFHWSAIDGFNADGSFAGTSVSTRFLKLQKSSSQEKSD